MMNNYIKAVGFLFLVAFTIFVCLYTYHSITTAPVESEPIIDSTAVDSCDTIQTCDTTQIYVYETDSCCSH